MALSLTSQIRRNADLLHAPAGHAVMMLSINEGRYYGLERVGRRIWEMLAEPQKARDICLRLVERYQVAPEVCEAEVLAFLAELSKHGIVDVTD